MHQKHQKHQKHQSAERPKDATKQKHKTQISEQVTIFPWDDF